MSLIAPIRAGIGGVITTQLNALPGSGVSYVGVDATGQLSLLEGGGDVDLSGKADLTNGEQTVRMRFLELFDLTVETPVALNSEDEILYFGGLPVALIMDVQNLIAAAVTGLLEDKGGFSCAANPNYPVASKGDCYHVTAAGKIGGASGLSVDIGDVICCSADNIGGTQASVGTSWYVLEHNLVGALLSSNNLSDLASAATARSNLGLVIGTHVQAWSAFLDTLAAINATSGTDALARVTSPTFASPIADIYLSSTHSPAFTYNGGGQLTTLTYSDGATKAISYNGDGTVATIVKAVGSTIVTKTFTYSSGVLQSISEVVT